MANRLLDLLSVREYLLADGATGTNLFAMGLVSGDAPELWNTDQPQRIRALHESFIAAGSDLILTNSFGGNRYRLKLHNAQGRVAELNRAAAQIARAVADRSARNIVVAGSIGPTGELFDPLGELTFAAGEAAFMEQAEALAAGGADVLWIETMSSEDEVRAAVAGAAVTGLPIICNVSFDTNGSTMMGITPTQHANLCKDLIPAPDAFGTNCGVGPAEAVACVLKMAQAAGTDSVLVAKANCGIPEFIDGAIRYNGTPPLMAEYARLVRDAGARIIGGCCGTTAEHVWAMAEALNGYQPGLAPDVDTIEARLGPISRGAKGCAVANSTRHRRRRAH